MAKRKEFWEKSAEAYIGKGRYAPGSLQRAMNEEAMELMQGNGYAQDFAADIRKIRERLQKPRANEKRVAAPRVAGRLRRNKANYADKFRDDVEKIRERIHGK